MRAVLGDEADLIGGHVFLWEDRADGAGGDARAAVDALVWVDVELIVAFVDAFDWANFDAGAVLGSDAGLGNDVCHVDLLLVLSEHRGCCLETVVSERESRVKRDKLECFTRD